MKKLLSALSLFFTVLIFFSSCGKSEGKVIAELSDSLAPPVKMRILITAKDVTAEANISFFSPNVDVTMKAEFLSPSILSGLKVERRKDGRLLADYEGVVSELDEAALSVVSASCDILELIRNDLSTYAKVVDPIDERYGQLELTVHEKKVEVFFDEKTKTILRITSELFDLPIRIDIIDSERTDDSITK